MMTYIFKYRRRLRVFFRSLKVVGHGFNHELDRMTLYFSDGGLREIHHWSLCDCKLGSDWVLAHKKEMERQAGQSIVINKDLNAH